MPTTPDKSGSDTGAVTSANTSARSTGTANGSGARGKRLATLGTLKAGSYVALGKSRRIRTRLWIPAPTICTTRSTVTGQEPRSAPSGAPIATALSKYFCTFYSSFRRPPPLIRPQFIHRMSEDRSRSCARPPVAGLASRRLLQIATGVSRLFTRC